MRTAARRVSGQLYHCVGGGLYVRRRFKACCGVVSSCKCMVIVWKQGWRWSLRLWALMHMERRRKRTTDFRESAILAVVLLWASHAVGLMRCAWVEARGSEGLMSWAEVIDRRHAGTSPVATPESSDALALTAGSGTVEGGHIERQYGGFPCSVL
jgi:hypothetical protein